MDQKTCMINLAHGKDAFAIVNQPILGNVCTSDFLTVSSGCEELLLMMRDQVEQMKRVRFLAAATDLGKESDEDEDKVTEWECKIINGSLCNLGLTLVHTTRTVYDICVFADLLIFFFLNSLIATTSQKWPPPISDHYK